MTATFSTTSQCSANVEKDFNRYEKENAGSKIDDYFGYPYNPPIPPEQDFINAKGETIKHLERRLACIGVLSFERFMTYRRCRKFFKGLFPVTRCPHLAQCPVIPPQKLNDSIKVEKVEVEKDFGRCELDNAGSKIDDYFGYLHHPPIPPEQDFINAKRETIKHLERQLACIRVLSFETFQADRRRGFFKSLFPVSRCPYLAQCPMIPPHESSDDYEGRVRSTLI